MQTPQKIAKMRERKRINCHIWITEFPCFRNIHITGLRPLKIGIDKDFCMIPRPLRPVSKTDVRRWLKRYCADPEYRDAIKAGTRRVDMLGRPV